MLTNVDEFFFFFFDKNVDEFFFDGFTVEHSHKSDKRNMIAYLTCVLVKMMLKIQKYH